MFLDHHFHFHMLIPLTVSIFHIIHPTYTLLKNKEHALFSTSFVATTQEPTVRKEDIVVIHKEPIVVTKNKKEATSHLSSLAQQPMND